MKCAPQGGAGAHLTRANFAVFGALNFETKISSIVNGEVFTENKKKLPNAIAPYHFTIRT